MKRENVAVRSENRKSRLGGRLGRKGDNLNGREQRDMKERPNMKK